MSTIVFRVDAVQHIGSGHLMRCLTLAQALKAQACTIHFISRDLPIVYHPLITEKGFILHHLTPAAEHPSSSTSSEWLSVDWQVEAKETSALLQSLKTVDVLVIDHYGLDAQFEYFQRPYTKKIMVIDDLANRSHDCDILLDQNFYRDQDTRYAQLVSAEAVCLLGPKYALIREEFLQARNTFPRQERPLELVKRINICFGGVDSRGDTIRTLAALKPLFKEKHLKIDVVTGLSFAHTDTLQTWLKDYPAIQWYQAPSNLAELLAQADLGIGAAGSMTWERAAVGLPSVAMRVADNQCRLAQESARLGLQLLVGERDQCSEAQLQSAIGLLLENSCLRQSFADQCEQLVDGAGAQRVARMLAPPKIVLKEVSKEDCQALFAWRNDPINRQFAHDSSALSYDKHQVWFEKTLHNDQIILCIGADDQGPLGVLRFDNQGPHWLVSIYLVPGRHGEGLGRCLLEEGLHWLQIHQKPTAIHAEIFVENITSCVIFERAGFKRQFLTYIKEYHNEN